LAEDKSGETKGEHAERVSVPDPDRDVDRARRKLLTTLVYAAPLVVSTVIVKPAHAQLASCAPAACRPGGGDCGPYGCPPRGGACGPAACRPRG
jgi:hypothetical protein